MEKWTEKEVLSRVYTLVLDETISQGELEILVATKRRLETDKENGRAIFGLERDLSFYSVNRTLSKSVSEFLTLLMDQYQPSFEASYGETKKLKFLLPCKIPQSHGIMIL